MMPKLLLAFIIALAMVIGGQLNEFKYHKPRQDNLLTLTINTDMKIKLQFEDEATIKDMCPSDNDSLEAMACIYHFKDNCIIIAPKPPRQEFMNLIDYHKSPAWAALGHEVMHCYGWTHEK